jgi:hypothetical protein
VAGAGVLSGVGEVVVAWDVWTCARWSSLVEDERVLEWNFERLRAEVAASFAGDGRVTVANRA